MLNLEIKIIQNCAHVLYKIKVEPLHGKLCSGFFRLYVYLNEKTVNKMTNRKP